MPQELCGNLAYVTGIKRGYANVGGNKVPLSRGSRGRMVAEVARFLGGR